MFLVLIVAVSCVLLRCAVFHQGLLMLLSNLWGLVMLILLLGYGVVEVSMTHTHSNEGTLVHVVTVAVSRMLVLTCVSSPPPPLPHARFLVTSTTSRIMPID